MSPPLNALSVETDVLVIGGGIAGALAAIRAAEQGATVTVVDKAFFGRGGCSALASGVFSHWQPGDDIEPWIRKMGGPLVNRRPLRRALEFTARIVPLLEEWGVRWVRDAGELLHVPGSTGSSPSVMMDGGGPQMMMAIRAEVLRRGIRVFDHVMVTDLLTSDGEHPTAGRVVGAVGLCTKTARPLVLSARATVVSAGPFALPYAPRGQGFQGMPRNASGDGQAMVARAGAVLGKLEFGGTAVRMYDLFCAPGLEMLLGYGGVFQNALGEAYLNRSMANVGERRSVLGVASLREYQNGRGPVFLDVRHFTPRERDLARRVIPIIVSNLESVGFETSRDPFPYNTLWPGTDGISGGGAAIKEDGSTTIPALWAAGGCTDGAYLTMGQELGTCAAMGWWAGESASSAVADLAPPEGVELQATTLIERALRPLSRPENGFEASQATLMAVPPSVGQPMNSATLSAAADRLVEIRSALQECGAADAHQLIKLLALQNAATIMELSFRIMLHREESRGTMLRSDYPHTDNERWLAWTRCRLTAPSELDVWEEALPDDGEFIPTGATRELHPYFAAQITEAKSPHL